jgi:hypothetical protein
MTSHPVLVIVGILGFLIFCCFVDSNGGGTDSFFYVFCRLIARHFKLAVKLFIGILLAYLAIGAAFEGAAKLPSPSVPGIGRNNSEAERFAGFMNRATAPLQWAVNGFINLLGFLAMAILFGVDQVARYYHQHPSVFYVAAMLLYSLWLGLNIYDIVCDELLSDDKMKRVFWSVVTFCAWAFIVLVIGEWI